MSWLVLASLALAGTPPADDSAIDPGGPVGLALQAELGALAPLSNRLQIGEEGTYVDIPRQLAQDVLFPFVRLQADLDVGWARRHTIALLYQPLDLRSVVAPAEDLQVGEVVFPAGEAVSFRYGFSFWRGTWLYDLAPDPDRELALGLGLQIRNASIVYAALDGSRAVATTDIGPVPLLVVRTRHALTEGLWIAGEASGVWAPIEGLNLSTSPVEGAIADVSVKLGLAGPQGADAFLGLRYLGGGAVGTSGDPAPFTDGFTRNWLHFAILSLGAGLR